ncbi:transcriptional regulator, Crp/Fnr family [hydrothermal vent metagenome]|uniref:Transcriptional regulator, Crp/Fnr family n=1 Tax=hydrothermal vent metagenome TaxID=652676 RepID=A0A3B0Z9Q0_9ZZZZ
MITTVEAHDLLRNRYPEVDHLLQSDSEAFLGALDQTRIPAGTRLFRESDRCENFMWLLEGTIRVFKHSPEGREITLYRVNPGELCVLSLQCLLSDERFPADAVAEDVILGLTLSKDDFDTALDDSKKFRRYLLQVLSKRIGDVVQLVSEVTFQRLDLRLACLLGQLFERAKGNALETTHAKLARELGTTREMVSRLLKELEHQQCIRLSRGRIHLTSAEGLGWLSRG